MSLSAISRRSFIAVAAASAFGSSEPAVAGVGRYQSETAVWSESMLIDAEGRSFALRELKRPITVLKLWASWCPACAAEMPQLAMTASALANIAEVVLISHPQYWAEDQVTAHRRRLPFRLATFAASNPPAIVGQALLGPAGEYLVPKTIAFRARDASVVFKHEASMNWASAMVVEELTRLSI